MSDITELAQSLKAAAIDAKELAIIARYSKGRAAAEKFYALANPNNVIALVEALEKAQKTIAFQQGEIKALLSSLESRTVKLPKPISVLHRREFTAAHCAIYAYPEAEVNAALDDAGIKVEAE
ncbi:TPA: ead/Ea22-like family protein [Klebsiella pneumoniae]|nr:ead/Ea22-like family protein [Klebsiella pneumoniae]HCA9322801.1 ead/Ea22-like family protein [Klebsiella pneumoniae]